MLIQHLTTKPRGILFYYPANIDHNKLNLCRQTVSKILSTIYRINAGIFKTLNSSCIFRNPAKLSKLWQTVTVCNVQLD